MKSAKPIMILMLPLVAIVGGCGHSHHDAHDHEGELAPMVLNDGTKWEADEHTMSMVEAMKLEIAEFDNTADGDHRKLVDSLTHQLSALVAGCTMEGPAHEELHKWLVPVTQSIKDLASAEEQSAARVEVDKMKESLREFDYYFEKEGD